MARKVQTHKIYNDGIKTPRNSQNLKIETSKIRYQKEELPYSSQVENKCSKNNNHPYVASVRKLINEELSKQSNSRNNAPNLVARLMGLDMMPLDPKSINCYANVDSVRKLMNDELSKQSSTKSNSPNLVARLMGLEMMPLETKSIVLSDQSTFENLSSSKFNSSSQMEFGSFDQHIDGGEMGQKFGKLMPRRRPREEELRKFKRELEAYQAAQENLDKEMMESIPAKKKEPFPSRNRTQSRDFRESLDMKSTRSFDLSFFPTTQITILKPGSDMICDCNFEENFIGSKETSQEGRTSIEDFLEEVRDRLVCEIQGKNFIKGYDVEANLFRSASTRSYKSEIELNGPSSPEFISRDTQRSFSESLRNVAKSEVHFDISQVFNHKVRLKQIMKDENEAQAGSFGRGPDDRNLVRSLSAPVSGTSFTRFPIENHHNLTKLESVETNLDDVKRQRKHRFNIKEKFSNFKHRFGLRGKLLVKKIQSIVEPLRNHDGVAVRDIRTGPTVLIKHKDKHENFTEVPPSPASSIEDNVMPEVNKHNRDISSGLNEPSIQLGQLESDVPEELIAKPESENYELVQLDDPAESYIRDLLVASGMYFGSCDKHLSRVDTFTKPIGNSVFEQVEESLKKYLVKETYENKLEHKILLDLLNEALSIVLEPPLTLMSKFRRKLNKFYLEPPSCGKELFKLVREIINVSLHPPSNSSFSLDSVLARDIGSISWCGLINDQINVFEREIACLIIDDLVEEFTKDSVSDSVLSNTDEL